MVLYLIHQLVDQDFVFIFQIFSICDLVDALENHAEFTLDELSLNHQNFPILAQLDDLVLVFLAFC